MLAVPAGIAAWQEALICLRMEINEGTIGLNVEGSLIKIHQFSIVGAKVRNLTL